MSSETAGNDGVEIGPHGQVFEKTPLEAEDKELGNAVENSSFQVEWPLVRTLDAKDILTVLQNKSSINTTQYDAEFDDEEEGQTFFWCTSPESPLPTTYSHGTDDIGIFIVFPEEANKSRPKEVDAETSGTYGFNTDEVFQVTIPPDSVIDYSKYLFIRPQDWRIVNSSQNIDEAQQQLEENGLNRTEIEEEAKIKIEGLLRMREEIATFLLTPDNPLVSDESLWSDFEKKFGVQKHPTDPETDSMIKANFDRYRTISHVIQQRSDLKEELIKDGIFSTFIEANYGQTKAIIEHLRAFNDSSKE